MYALFFVVDTYAGNGCLVSAGCWLIIRGKYLLMIFRQFRIHLEPNVAFTIANKILLGHFTLQYFVFIRICLIPYLDSRLLYSKTLITRINKILLNDLQSVSLLNEVF